MNMRVSHVAKILSNFYCLPAIEKRARLAKIYQTGGMEALEAAALLIGQPIHQTKCMAGVEAKRVKKTRYSRTGREKPTLKEFHREVTSDATKLKLKPSKPLLNPKHKVPGSFESSFR